jgi:hypothetical protein
MNRVSPGASSLRRWVKGRGFRKASAMLGASRAAVGAWATGSKTPNAEMRAKLEKVVCIPPSDWDIPAPKPGAAKSEGDTQVSAVAPNASAKTVAVAHLADIRARHTAAKDSGASIRELALLDNALSKAVATYGRLSGELELTEAQVLRAPAFQRCMNTIMGVLADYPDIATKLSEALSVLAGDKPSTS